jgi:hypothetical protein
MCCMKCLTRNTPLTCRVPGELLQSQTNQELMQDGAAPSAETSASNGVLVPSPVSEDADLGDGRSAQTSELPASQSTSSSSFTLRSTTETKYNDDWTKAEPVPGGDRNDDRKPGDAGGRGGPTSTGSLEGIEAGVCNDITEPFRAVKVVDSPFTSEEEEEETRKRRGGGLVLHSKSADPAVVKQSSPLTLRSTAERKDSQKWQQSGWTDSE